MARTLRSSTAAPAEPVDTSIEWSARLVQPKAVVSGSHQPVILEVSAPERLDGSVSVQVGDRTMSATWLGEPGQTRRCSTGFRAGRGPVDLRVYALVGGTKQYAGIVSVTR